MFYAPGPDLPEEKPAYTYTTTERREGPLIVYPPRSPSAADAAPVEPEPPKKARTYDAGVVRGYQIGLLVGGVSGAAMMARGGWVLAAVGIVAVQLVVLMLHRETRRGER